MWKLKTAGDLVTNQTFVRKGDHLASAHKITAPPAMDGSAVTFTVRALWSSTPDEESVTLTPDQDVYVLICTCNGMSFIQARWTFTGECSCVHVPLPGDHKES